MMGMGEGSMPESACGGSWQQSMAMLMKCLLPASDHETNEHGYA